MGLFRFALLSALLSLLAACGGTPTGSTTDETGSSPVPATVTAGSQTETSPSPAMAETTLAGGVGTPLVVFTRSGGIAGITETLVVQSDGTLQMIQGEIGGQVNVLLFIVIIMGGLGSTLGCVVGALALGLVTNYVGFLAPKAAMFSSIGLMVAVLAWRPQGLYPVVNR